MKTKLPHIKRPPKDWSPIKTNKEWYDKITVEDLQKHPWLEKIQHRIENTGESIIIDKDKTRIVLCHGWGDETVFDIETGKIIDYSLGL